MSLVSDHYFTILNVGGLRPLNRKSGVLPRKLKDGEIRKLCLITLYPGVVTRFTVRYFLTKELIL